MNESDDKNFDDELMAAAAELTTEVTPDRDLWPDIVERLDSVRADNMSFSISRRRWADKHEQYDFR